MRRNVRTPDRTVREEMRILERIGFHYHGTDSAGHHLFEHPSHGALRPMSSTPRNSHAWRRRHREAVARLMGLNLFQFERLIAGQPLERQTRRRRTEREIRARGRRPVSLMIAAVEPAATTVKSCGPVPNPGSSEACAAGCICPVYGNRHGLGLEGRDGVFEYVLGCPVHVAELAA